MIWSYDDCTYMLLISWIKEIKSQNFSTSPVTPAHIIIPDIVFLVVLIIMFTVYYEYLSRPWIILFHYFIIILLFLAPLLSDARFLL